MARPRQRRKLRNPTTKVSRKQKNRKNISFAGCGHRLIAENWDKTKTLKQNYERLGLLTQLNGRAGGEGDAMVKDVYTQQDHEEDGIDYQQLAQVAIERGAIGLRRCLEDDTMEEVPLRMPMEQEDDSDVDLVDGNKDLDPRAVGIGKRIGRTHHLDMIVGHKIIPSTKPQQTSLYPILEQMIQEASNVLPTFRHTSEQEARFLMDMARKHGSDYERMSRDKKMNPMLLTVSQLKKKFARLERDLTLLQSMKNDD